MSEIIGITYIELNWHYWLGAAVVLLVNISLQLFAPMQFYYSSEGKWSHVLGPVIFTVIFYYGIGIILKMLGLN